MSQEKLIQEIKEKFENRFSVLQSELNRELDQIAQATGKNTGMGDIAGFVSLLHKLKNGYSQTELLNSLLDSLSEYVPRAILLIAKDESLFGWAARGFGSPFNEKGVKQVRWNVGQFPELQRCVKSEEHFEVNYSDLSELSESISSLDDFSPVKSAFFPVLVRNKVAGVLYLDSGDTMSLDHLDVAEILVHVASMELTMVTTKLKKKKKEPEQVEAPPAPAKEETPEPAPSFGAPVEQADPQQNPAIALPSHDSQDSKEEKKARRVARVLISDLILYNEDKVAEGRRSGDLYNLLKEDIDRSYEHFQSRTKDLVPDEPNLFKIELIKQLAEGQESLLGPLPF